MDVHLNRTAPPALPTRRFDGKMKAITDLLQGYQAERTAQAKGLPVQRQGREREGPEQGEQQGHGGGGGGGAGPRRRGSRPLTATAAPGAGAVAPGSEEFFLQVGWGGRGERCGHQPAGNHTCTAVLLSAQQSCGACSPLSWVRHHSCWCSTCAGSVSGTHAA